MACGFLWNMYSAIRSMCPYMPLEIWDGALLIDMCHVTCEDMLPDVVTDPKNLSNSVHFVLSIVHILSGGKL